MEYRVNVDLANTTKAELASVIDGKDDRILNRVGAFSSLFLHLVGLAHITGGGIRENLNRILPPIVDARIDLKLYQPPPVFEATRAASNASIDLMLRTFNLGVGLALICRADLAVSVVEHLTASSERAYVIGETVPGSGRVDCHGTVSFGA